MHFTAYSPQVASYNGYVTVHWDKLQKDAVSVLDTNNDGEVSLPPRCDKCMHDVHGCRWTRLMCGSCGPGCVAS